jgi:lipopolysaccharide transport system permease protein
MAVIVRSYQSIFYDHALPEMLPLLGVFLLAVGLLWLSANIFESRRDEFAELV